MIDNNGLRNRVAVVTGASAGIGRAVARTLAEHGAGVVINARRLGKLEELATEINDGCSKIEDKDPCTIVQGDASDDAVIDSMLDRACEHFGAQSDLVVVNAGRGLNGSVMTSNTSEWEEMIRTNLLGAAKLIRAAGQRLVELQEQREWPSKPADLVILGSTVGRHISPFSSMYGSTKFAVNSLAEAVRREIGPKGVRVSLIEPAIVRSEFQSVAGYDPEGFGTLMDKFGPVLEPDDIARSIAFICSQPASVHISDIVVRPTRQDYP